MSLALSQRFAAILLFLSRFFVLPSSDSRTVKGDSSDAIITFSQGRIPPDAFDGEDKLPPIDGEEKSVTSK